MDPFLVRLVSANGPQVRYFPYDHRQQIELNRDFLLKYFSCQPALDQPTGTKYLIISTRIVLLVCLCLLNRFYVQTLSLITSESLKQPMDDGTMLRQSNLLGHFHPQLKKLNCNALNLMSRSSKDLSFLAYHSTACCLNARSLLRRILSP